MTTYALFRVSLKTRGGLTIYARAPEREGCPVAWTRDPKLADCWMHAGALEIHARLLREKKPAHIEPFEEITT